MSTKQETFDRVVRFIIEQGRPAMQGANCRYRAPVDDGGVLKCAAGCLLPDELYESRFEGITLARPAANSPNCEANGALREAIAGQGHDLDLVHHLQEDHDWAAVDPEPDGGSGFLAEFRRLAASTAELHGLSAAVLS